MPGYHLPYFAADVEGIYEAHGLDVEVVYPEPGPENIKAVAAGRYDLCLTSVAHFLRAVTEEPNLEARFVLMVARHTHMAVLCAQDASKSSALGDLDGASYLGDRASPFTREYLHLAERIGIKQPSLIEVPYGDVKEALARGRGDVTADYLDLLPDYQAPARERDRQVKALPFHAAGIDVYGSGLVAGVSQLETRPQVVQATVAAIRAALEQARRDPLPGARALVQRFPDAGLQRTLDSWRASEELIFLDDGRPAGTMDPAKWYTTIEHHARVHGTARVPSATVYSAIV
ncbi:MAG: ABC transporter substrate-binding protein [Actinomycetota bacterium]|nr:ABC transporter substrate-binding protein [Actinomycetota bacterium]